MAEPIPVRRSSGAPALKAVPDKPDPQGPSNAPSRSDPPPAAAGSDQRRRDALADAARTLDDLSPNGVREFVVRRWRGTRVLTDADVQQFSKDAIVQREHDIVDALDGRLRKISSGRVQAARVVRVAPPRGWLKRTISALPDDQLSQVLLRLRSRGWDEQQITRNVLKPYLGDRKVEMPKLSLEDEGFSMGSSPDG